MKTTACIINTLHGPGIDERALVATLHTGTIASASLFVYENQPGFGEVLYDLGQAMLAPQLGSATIRTTTKLGIMAAENCLAGCRGDPPNLVNPEIHD